MKKILFVIVGLLVGVANSEAQLSKSCSGVKPIGSQFIYKNSAPLRSGGVGTALIGYRREPTLICNVRDCGGNTLIYDKNGKAIARCPWTTAEGHAGGRYRCTFSTAALRRVATNNTGNPAVYFKLRTGQCVEVPDAGRCYGSSKGLCNQTIK